MTESLNIAQISPYPWEDEHDVNVFVSELAQRLAQRGHRLLVLCPSRSPELVRESRRLIRSARSAPEKFFDPEGNVRVLGVGELLPLARTRRGIVPSPPIAIARTIEEVLANAQLDLVHVHEPFAPSASSVGLRNSRALNVGTFHAPTERVLSTQVARRFFELFFGQLDARVTSFAATRDLMQRFFPADYRLVLPGATLSDEERKPDEERDGSPGEKERSSSVRIVFSDQEERGALRLLLRALRQLPDELDWTATVISPTSSAPSAALSNRLRQRVQLLSHDEALAADPFRDADIVVAASLGQALAPGVLLRAIGAQAVPVATRLPAYEELLSDGEFGLLFEPGDALTPAAQIEKLIRDPALRKRLRANASRLRKSLAWDRVADDYQKVYAELAARRHSAPAKSQLHRRLAQRPLIDVDLHMHTDHSYDCATPVEALLATARTQGLGAIAITDHNEISGAHDAAAKAGKFGVKVIVAEEIKTADQGEIIGLFIKDKIPRGLTLEQTIIEIRKQEGLVYVPHPFDRMHAVPDYEHLLDVVEDIDVIEVYNPRVAIGTFNEEATRFAAKYRIVAGAGSDSHVTQGLGSVRIRMRDFNGPEEFLESLRMADIIRKPSSLLYVQALKFLQTKATPSNARRASRARRVRKAVANGRANGSKR